MKKNRLIVDDWEVNRQIGCDLLRHSEENHFWMVLRMPDMNRLEAVREIRTLRRADAKQISIKSRKAYATISKFLCVESGEGACK